jgi:two-component system, NarL family, invasion response regulator UvrY
MIKILVADDHSMMRSGLKKILKEENDMEVTAEAATHAEVLASLAAGLPDLVLLDISMPGRDGLETLKEIKSLYPKLKVLMLSMHPEDRYAVRAIKAGASGYVSKESAADELVSAIRRVCSGLKYISATLAEKMAAYFETDLEKPPHELLSDREFQVLCRIASGKSMDEIASELSLSANTIATYRERVLLKLRLHSNVELTNYAHRNKLID